MAKKKLKTLIIGKLSYKMQFTVSCKLSDIPSTDKSVRMIDGADVRRQFGGMAGNVAYGLSVLDGNPFVISQVGKDFDSFYRSHLESQGIQLKLFVDPEKETACFYEILDEEDEKVIIKQENSYRLFAENNLETLIKNDDYANFGSILICTGKAEADVKFISEISKVNNRIPIIYSPDSNIHELTKYRLSNIFEHINMLICTEEELQLIEQRMKQTRDEILKNFPALKYIISLEERTRIVINSSGFKIKVSEGPAEEILSIEHWRDAFRAAIVYGVSIKKPIEETAKIGSALASYAVETRECHKYSPSLEQVTLRSFEVKTIKKES
ncbi:MAG: PfkB family carbohydrate kinase [Candidatus Hodarchaeales archaeon]|jgi:adenosine kinase